MNKFLRSVLALIISCMFFTACKKQAPQLPSNKGVEIDNVNASLIKINQRLATKEDLKLVQFTKNKGSFKKNEIGFWYEIYNSGNGPLLRDSSSCKLFGKLMLLNGKTVEEDTKQLVIGKKEVIAGLEEGLKLMRKGDSATFIIPWYLGYGMIGRKPQVPPYTSIIYKIKILD